MWLLGSGGRTRLVLVVDIRESFSNTPKRIESWDLSDDEILKLDIVTLAEHILQWHERNRIPLIGKFTANFWLCFWNKSRQHVWEYELSLDDDELEPKGDSVANFERYIMAKDLLPDLDESLRIQLPLEKLSTKMRNCLRVHRMSRAAFQAKEKWKKLRAEKQAP
ncbi:hypothetical protein AJ80_07485 [Polytolypa hystricis UAMH7299]|uniref:Uncharacterized protein n=1 Tax=Polytolypa hystricis (strain UAMH7299) TaxID=1447883 RepID=A0A2B7XNI9_POLH7|nr:hypothetical protein AJ80_07485 [Polytolypa hystricis UAMH7299]